MTNSNSKSNKSKRLKVKKTLKKSTAEIPKKRFPIVGIGASAGGLEAFTIFLKSLPVDTGMAFIFIQHLDPSHDSLGPEILSRCTRMQVRQVEDGMRVHPNCVYLIPPNCDMVLTHGMLTLLPRTESRGQHLIIDSFFQSLAKDQRGRAIGVVLSGAASDGTDGLRAIKAEGGLTIAQDPKTAKHGDMPKNAIMSGAVDLTLPPEEIAHELVRISKHPYIAAACESQSETEAEFAEQVDDKEQIENRPDDSLRKIFAILQINTRVDFSNYKHGTLKRRIQRRMLVRRTDTFEAYAQYLRDNSEEILSLYNDILINVTEFFRDPDSYKGLAEQVFPQLIKTKDLKSPIRIWIAACATGEEVYSIAILLFEFLAEAGCRRPIQIFATDISEPCLQKARAGLYSESNLRGLSKERIKRFFEKVDGGYKINKSIRQLCLFSKHDLNADPAFGKLDLVSCRNILIYFTPTLQKRIISVFHFALKIDGFLWLGKSEGIGGATKLFTVMDKTHKIYSKNNVLTPMTFRFPISPYLPDVQEGEPVMPENRKEIENFQRDADRITLAKYAPPSVVVNSEMEILQFRGPTSAYLQIPSGEPSNNLFKIAIPEVVQSLRIVLQEARKLNRQARHECEIVDLDGNHNTINIQVIPINPQAPLIQRKFVIFFEKALPGPLLEKKKGAKRSTKVEKIKGDRKQQDVQIARLEQDASASKLYHRAMIEDFEATREELTAGNEELQSTNEELQSTNEELETAKEEVQSTNEELTTVNDELRDRNTELTSVMGDLNNILASADIPLIIIDNDHRIRRFTPQAARVFNFIDSDIGRPLDDIRAAFDMELGGLVSKVIESLILQEREIQDNKGRWMKLQIRPFRTIDNRIDGAVITLLDIDALKRSLDTARSQRERFSRLAAISGIGISYCDLPLKDLNWDETTRKHFWMPANVHITMDTFYERLHPEDRERARKVIEESITSRTLCDVEYRTISPSDDAAVKWIRGIGWADYSPEGIPVRFDGVTLDITEQKKIIQRLEDETVKLEAIFDASPTNMILLRGPTLIFEKVNPSYRELVGGRDVTGKALLDALPEVEMQPFFDSMKVVFETGIPYNAKEELVRVIRAPGGNPQDTYFDYKYSRVNDSQGMPYGVYAHSTDITEKVMARKQIEQLAKSLSESVQARDEFMSIASHELKTPITGMKLQTQMFKRAIRNNSPQAFEPTRVTEIIHAVDHGLDRMTRLVEDMLDISRIQLGKLSMECEPTDISKLVAEIIDRLKPELTSAGINVKTKLTDELRCNLDRFRFEQVLTNLATNAIRYAANANVEVELKQEVNNLVLRFRDHGPGVPKADHEKIFKRFERLVSADKTSGMGLGLYICREIVEAHGGSIRIDAETSPGTCFLIELPIKTGVFQ